MYLYKLSIYYQTVRTMEGLIVFFLSFRSFMSYENQYQNRFSFLLGRLKHAFFLIYFALPIILSYCANKLNPSIKNDLIFFLFDIHITGGIPWD